jgi:hypothetical protein
VASLFTRHAVRVGHGGTVYTEDLKRIKPITVPRSTLPAPSRINIWAEDPKTVILVIPELVCFQSG